MNAELDALAYNSDPMFVHCPIEDCPNPATRVTMVPDWQTRIEDETVSIIVVGCGNPWHYAEDIAMVRPLDDDRQVVSIEKMAEALYLRDRGPESSLPAWLDLSDERSRDLYRAEARRYAVLPETAHDRFITAEVERVTAP